MNWRLGGFISERLAGVLIPLCVYGLLATLVLHLIDLRSAFVAGGEVKLRQATLAFAAGVVLLERLAWLAGPSVARAYAWTLGLVMTLFAVYTTEVFRLPLPWPVAFALTEGLFAILWWAGHRLSQACAVNDERAVAASAESGILRALRPRIKDRLKSAAPATPETQWTDKLVARHPGRVLLHFSLVALPLFGAGLFVFRPDDPARLRLGMMLFLYLWCALSLLALSSLRQLIVYFHKRDVSLPDLVGLTWIALGFVMVTGALLLAFALPQPPSPQNVYVREQLTSVYRGWESQHGIREKGNGKSNSNTGNGTEGKKGGMEDWARGMRETVAKGNQAVDRAGDAYLSELQRGTGFAPEAQQLTNMVTGTYDGFRKVFEVLLKVLGALVGVCVVMLLFVIVVSLVRRLREGSGALAQRLGRLARHERAPERATPAAAQRFAAFTDPFRDPARANDLRALTRYLWEAMLAWCADAGAPCSPDLTPLEFIDSAPAPLQGFEPSARWIARVFTFSEFSTQPVPEATLPELQRFWSALQQHANS